MVPATPNQALPPVAPTTEVSPVSKMLKTMGMTRADLTSYTGSMREFLAADSAASRVPEREAANRPRSGSDLPPHSRTILPSQSFARSLSRASSSSRRDSTPPATPIKSEPREGRIPHRRDDSMDAVLERQRRKWKSRKEKERESARSAHNPPSPSPSSASRSGRTHSLSYTRDEYRMLRVSASESSVSSSSQSSAIDPPPATPHKSKHYRDHTNLSGNSQPPKETPCKAETPTPTRPAAQGPSQNQPLAPYYAYPAYMAYPQYMSAAGYRPAQASSSVEPATPRKPQTQTQTQTASSPLPPSSPPAPSSPMSSPARVLNLVSSPGPMGPEPDEDEYDSLPYKLPPGPYSPVKPELSYAALVGRAILSSPEHRLTLQEIYDWITIVFPHYKRGETTWMNSIRHVLSTTVVFRKVPRDRSVGRTLWAIFDEDLECFKDGGFKKHPSKDEAKPSSSSRTKSRARKRADDEDGDRKNKKLKKEVSSSTASVASSSGPALLTQPTLGAQIIFPASRPTPHLQPYYQSCLPQGSNSFTNAIFPPLPATAGFNSVVSNSGSVTSESNTGTSGDRASPPSTQSSSPGPAPTLSSSPSTSLPELMPHRDSSSPPSSLPPSSDIDIDMQETASSAGEYRPLSTTIVDDTDDGPSSLDDEANSIFNTTLLGPVKYWGRSPDLTSGLQPSIELDSTDEDIWSFDRKGKKKESRNYRGMDFPPVPTSPTLNVRSVQAKAEAIARPTTPVSLPPPPTTPPRRAEHQISSIRTPISHKGLHMSPSASLAHYKTNLDPPPAVGGGVQPLEMGDEPDILRTPRRGGSHATPGSASAFGNPMTPRKLVFGSAYLDSPGPFQTPSGFSGFGSSPFGFSMRRGIIDPLDAGRLLREELRERMVESSPAEPIFAREALLSDSPRYERCKYPD